MNLTSLFSCILAMLRILLIGLFALWAFTASAAIRYVKAGGSGNGSSWANASGNLQAMINASTTGDQVWVAAGTYKPTTGTDRDVSFGMKNGVEILGGFPASGNPGLAQRDWNANPTILSGDIGTVGDNSDNSYNVILNYENGLTNSAVLDGFTVTGGKGENIGYPRNCGGGLFNRFSSPTIKNCIFSNNETSSFGGGMYNDNSSPTVTNCIFEGNNASSGGGMYNNTSSAPVVTNCVFRNNFSSPSNGGGGAMANYAASPTLRNCTMSGNSAPRGNAMNNSGSSNVHITNCILWNNGNEILNTSIGTTATVNYSIVQGGYVGTANSDADPLFADAAGGDFRLSACSPAIDAGNDADNFVSEDLDGNPREFEAVPGGQMIDMGAYEYQTAIFSGVWHVNAAAATPGSGVSWDCPMRDLQQALAVATSGDQIWVAGGTYKPTAGTDRSISFVVKNGVEILGGFPNTGNPGLGDRNWSTNVSTLSGDIGGAGNGDNSYQVMFFDHVSNSTLLDGFTITGGNGETEKNGGGIYNDGSGVGRQSNPRIANCTITGNVARSGAGLFNDGFRGNSSPEIVNCIFSGNKATRDGGGTYNFGGNNGNSSPLFINCIFSGNKAERIGGGVFNDAVDGVGGICNPNFVNCSFSGNQADFGAGGIYNDAFTGTCSPTIVNCILWGNAGQIDNRNATPNVKYSLIEGGYSGTANLDLNPLFVSQPPVGLGTVGDLRLQACSPAIDAGNDVDNSTTTDLDGNDRKYEAIGGGQLIDMGAYEYQQSAPVPVATCKNFTAVLNPNSVTVSATDIDNGSSSTCGNAALSINGQPSISYTCSDIGPNTVILTAYSAQSNRSASCQTTLTIRDNIAPTIDCPANTTLALGSNCSASLPAYALTSKSDNCAASGSIGESQSPIAGSTVSGHNTAQTVTLTANDGNGNTTACQFTVTLKDVSKPTITCPANTTLALGSNCSASLPAYTLTSKSDNCAASGSIGESQSPIAGSIISGHNTVQTVTLTANDGNGNTTACQFTVTLKDVSKPIITCPANTTLALGSNCSRNLPGYALTSKSDNCAASGSIDESQSPIAGSTVSGHNTAQTVTLTANDGNGNTTACQFTVTLKDVSKPTITCPANTTLALGSNCSASLPAYTLTSKSDNCAASGSIDESQSPIAGSTVSGHNIAQTVTLTADDGNGNQESCSFTVTLKDVSKPTITCPGNTTLALGGNCSASLPAYTLTSKSDNCAASGSIGESQNPIAGSTVSGHNAAQTVTLTADDGNGNTTACQFTVTLKDVSKPTITCPANTTLALGNNCSASLPGYALTSKSDNCAASGSIGESQNPIAGSSVSGHNTAQTVTLTANDGNGNTTACQFTVTLKDITPPGIVCPNNRTVNADAGLCSSTQTYTVTASDNCSYTLTRTNGFASGTAFPLGLNVVNWQVTDAGGSSTTCSFSITVTDNQTPSITCPSSSTVNATTGQCAAVFNYSVSGSDNCSGWSLLRTSGLQSGALFPVGITTVNWKNTDTGGNSTSCSFTVTVTDGQLPGITCPANITANAAGGSCAATINYTTPTVSDNCSGASAMHVSGGTSGSSFNKGVNTIQWKATDGANNTRTCSFTITVNDTQAPTITCPVNITANTATGTCAATVTFNNATATDNCTPPPTVAQTGGQASGSSFPKGMHTLTFLATDGVGLTKACTFRITVVDNVLPTITCPGNIVKNTDNNLCSAVTNYTVTGADNCTSVSVSRVSGFASGAAFPRGSSTVIWRATDLAGNSTLCSFTVTVNDAQLPGITCPASISTNTTTGQCSKVVNYTTPTYSDNCAGGSISLLSGLASGSVFPTGVSTVIWRAFDNSANSADCAFTVTVTDNELPVITCPPAASVSGSGSPCGFPSAQLNTPSATDNCAVTSLASDAPASLPAGATLITWTAKDAANNQKTCAYTVTVNCGTAGMMNDEIRMMNDAERESASFLTVPSGQALITHHSSLITHHLSLSPNPASDIVVVTLSNQQINNKSNQQPSASNQHLSIYDAQGRLVWQSVVNGAQMTIDLGTLPSGAYQVVWRSETEVLTKKLMVQKG